MAFDRTMTLRRACSSCWENLNPRREAADVVSVLPGSSIRAPAPLMDSLLLCPEYFDGRLNGIGRVAEAIHNALAASGSRVCIWSANDATGSNIDLRNRVFQRGYTRLMATALLAPPCPLDLVGSLHLGLAPAARLAAWRRHCSYFVFIHGIEAWTRLRPRTRWGLRSAKVLLFNSEHTRRRFHQANPDLAALPTELTPLGVPSFVSTDDESVKRSHQILCVTRLTKVDRYKNVRVLLEAFAAISRRLADAKLVVIGDGDDRANLEAYAVERIPNARVRFLGRISDADMIHWWSTSAVFALPSENEGFGLVFAEAMAAGLPCVCGNSDAAREVVQDGVTGFAVDPGSPEAVASALFRLLENPELCATMSRAAYSRYAAYFRIESFAERFLVGLRRHGILPVM